MSGRRRRSAPRFDPQSVQHIEIVTPDDPSWWDDAPADAPLSNPPPRSDAPPGRHRRRIIGAVLVAVTAVAVAAVAVLINDDDTRAETRPVSHFVMDWPDLRKYSADIVTPLPAGARYTLFASGNPTDPWISLQTYRQVGDARPFLDSWRREVANRTLITPRDERSLATVVVDLGGGWAADVRAFNVDDRQLVQFANSLSVTDEGAGDVTFDEGLLAANNLMSTRSANWADELLYGNVTTEMRSETVDGTLVTLREAETDVDTRLATLGYFTTGRLESSDGYTAATLTPSGESIVIWASDGRLLSLTGRVPTTELLSISRSVRLADAAEWRSLVYGLRPDYRLGDFAEAGSGRSADGLLWRSGIQLAARGGRTEFLWWWTLPGATASASTPTGIDLAARAGNETIVVGTSTFVFVWVPADSGATSAAVRAADGSIVTVQLRQLFVDVGVRLAATRIDVPGPVEISTD